MKRKVQKKNERVVGERGRHGRKEEEAHVRTAKTHKVNLSNNNRVERRSPL